jgi:8-oxo-dGTP pyrophosphatase MutT (NUDIX family)
MNVDLVDDSGTIRLTDVPPKESRTHEGLYGQIVVVVVWSPEGKLLIQKRGTFGEDPGRLDHVVGMVDTGEVPEQAAVRESLEEGSVTLKELHLVEQGINAYSRYQYLYGAVSTDRPVTPDTGEVDWIQWMTEGDIRLLVRQGASFCMEFFDDIEKTRPWAETFQVRTESDGPASARPVGTANSSPALRVTIQRAPQ